MPCTIGSVLSKLGLPPLKGSQSSEGDINLSPSINIDKGLGQSYMGKCSGSQRRKEDSMVSSQRGKGVKRGA